jgi:molybdopterin synthase catalytic subunit
MTTVHVRLFAGLKQLVGSRELHFDLPPGANIEQLRARLGDEYPVLQAFLPTLVCAVDEEYVSVDHVLRDGDLVAVIPPVSGGTLVELDPLFLVTEAELDPGPLVEAVRVDAAGAVALFYGVVRNENLGRRVLYLEYDAYPEMAVKKMRQVADEVRQKFLITGVGVHHRVGRLEIGETSLLVAVSSGHRAEAFEACHYAVDRIKQVVPIWKKEVFEGGQEWIEGHVPEVQSPAPPDSPSRDAP